MTRHTVIYRRSAQGDLARIWSDASDREAVAAAAHEIDLALAVDPGAKGHPLGRQRIYFTTVLGAVFTVSADDRLVTVLKVRRIDGR